MCIFENKRTNTHSGVYGGLTSWHWLKLRSMSRNFLFFVSKVSAATPMGGLEIAPTAPTEPERSGSFEYSCLGPRAPPKPPKIPRLYPGDVLEVEANLGKRAKPEKSKN